MARRVQGYGTFLYGQGHRRSRVVHGRSSGKGEMGQRCWCQVGAKGKCEMRYPRYAPLCKNVLSMSPLESHHHALVEYTPRVSNSSPTLQPSEPEADSHLDDASAYPSLHTPPPTNLPCQRQPLDLHSQLPPRLARHLILPRNQRLLRIPQPAHVLRRKDRQRPLRPQQDALDDLVADVVDETLEGDLVVGFEDVVDVVDGGRLVAEVDVGFHLGEVDGGGVHLAVLEAEALEAVEEALGARGLQVIGEVVVVGEEVAVAFVLEEGGELCLGFGESEVDGGLKTAAELLPDMCIRADFVEERFVAVSDPHEDRVQVPGGNGVPFTSLLREESLQDNGIDQA